MNINDVDGAIDVWRIGAGFFLPLANIDLHGRYLVVRSSFPSISWLIFRDVVGATALCRVYLVSCCFLSAFDEINEQGTVGAGLDSIDTGAHREWNSE